MAAILNLNFWWENRKLQVGSRHFLIHHIQKTLVGKFSCFYPEVHDVVEKCYISAPLHHRFLSRTA